MSIETQKTETAEKPEGITAHACTCDAERARSAILEQGICEGIERLVLERDMIRDGKATAESLDAAVLSVMGGLRGRLNEAKEKAGA